MDSNFAIVIDCVCGLRYMKSEVRTLNVEAGEFVCPCGDVLGTWQGQHRLVFEAEEAARLN